MRIFVPKPLRKNKQSYNSGRSRKSMIKSLNKRGFTEALLNSKSDKELNQMMNRFVSSKHTPSTSTMGKLQAPRNWIYL